MNVDVEIYLSNFIKFFKSNPTDLLSLVPKEMEEEFYKEVKEVSIDNVNKGQDPQLTQKQIIDICVKLNSNNLTQTTKIENEEYVSYIIGTKMGSII